MNMGPGGYQGQAQGGLPQHAPMQARRPAARAGKAEVDPNNVSMMSIPKQTKFFVDRMRNEA